MPARNLRAPSALPTTSSASTRYIAGDRFSYGDIPLGLRVHRWHVLGLAQETPPNIARWYTEIKARLAFNVYTADPAHHLEG